jgi:hypothetical protein
MTLSSSNAKTPPGIESFAPAERKGNRFDLELDAAGRTFDVSIAGSFQGAVLARLRKQQGIAGAPKTAFVDRTEMERKFARILAPARI